MAAVTLSPVISGTPGSGRARTFSRVKTRARTALSARLGRGYAHARKHAHLLKECSEIRAALKRAAREQYIFSKLERNKNGRYTEKKRT